ncbi:MAG: hypothetical protein IJD04_05640, partial [Desulfovibrionaceae bacterium]|nr:hypothetical protein [Desulfovibrionaceae bacterium]
PHCPQLQNLSAQSLWLSLVSIMYFWYETKFAADGGKIALSLMEPELAFLGETVLVSDGAAGAAMEAGGLASALPAGAAVGKLLGLGPDGQLRLGTVAGEALFASGSVYPLSRPG